MSATLTNLAPPESVSRAAQSARNLIDALDAAFIERNAESTLLVCALIAGQHALLLGPPGTGKSALTNAFAGALDYSGTGSAANAYWSYLFGRFTLPEEVFGPFSLPALEQGVQTRVTTSKLPECRVAFLDEVFKANSAILNNLLTILNERWFDNPTRQTVPLETCIGASNELPEGGADGELGALYDRFLVRRWVMPIRNRDSLRSLLLSGSKPAIACKLTAADIAELRGARDAVVLDGVIDLVLDLKDHLEQQHGIMVSDRRWGNALKLVAAHAVLNGRTVADASDLMVLTDCLWNEPDERAPIAGAVAKVADPDLAEALELRDAAIQLFSGVNTKASATDAEVAQATSVAREINKVLSEMRRLRQSSAIAETVHEVDGLVNAISDLMRKRMGW